QPAEPASARQGAQEQTCRAQGQAVQPWPREHSPPQRVSQTFPAIWLAVMLQFTQANQHVRDIDLYRARRLAGAAQRGGVRQVRIFTHAVVQRREDAANGARVNSAVGVSADAAIDRTGIEAGPAANALQAF